MTRRTERIVVEQTLPSERLDNFLRARLPEVSRGTIRRLIAQENIRINGRPTKPTHHPRAGEEIELRWPAPKPSAAQPEEMSLEILYEDSDLVVLNKPPGMVVHPSAGHEEHTLVNALLHHCGHQLSGIGGVVRPGIVHRLDKETSGCLVVAKNDATHLALSGQFAHREVQKTYLALVCGKVSDKKGEIHAAIARHPSHRKRMTVTDGHGREAWTSYRILERLGEATLLEALLHTGRTHQIRVHFQHLGFPLLGDITYGKRQTKRVSEVTGYTAPRQMLHAQELAFVHPSTHKRMEFSAPLPNDFEAALIALRGALCENAPVK